ncbi:MAG TPA: hypothetical protein VNM16_06465, partial [Bacillota bacterium]|nr:hypothetical protein [Bacillota bacterium]
MSAIIGRSLAWAGVAVFAMIGAGCGQSAANAVNAAQLATATAPAPAAPAARDGLPLNSFSPTNPPPAWPGPLPYPILIADEQNDRMIEVTPDKRIIWQY